MDNIQIFDLHSIQNRAFKSVATEFKMRFKDEAFEIKSETITPKDMFRNYNNCFDEMLRFIDQNVELAPRDRIGVKMSIPTIENVKPFGMRYLERREITGEMITDLLLSVQQSNSIFQSNDLFEVSVTIIHVETGGARVCLSKLSLNNYHELIKTKNRSILRIPNEYSFNDEKCLPRALILGKVWADCNRDKKLFKKLFKNNNFELNRLTEKLIKDTFKNYESYEFGGVLQDISKFAKKLFGYQIIVYDEFEMHRRPVFTNKKCDKQINLFFLESEKHFFALSNAKTFFGVKFKCELCDKLSQGEKHKCSYKCSSCFQSPKCRYIGIKKYSKHCSDCNRYFINDVCFHNHKVKKLTEKYTICEQLSICRYCLHFVDRAKIDKFNKTGETHQCGEKLCDVCRKIVSSSHNCTIQPYLKSMPKHFTIVFYDLETTQTKQNFDNPKQKQYEHEPILVCAQKVCEVCWKIPEKDYQCSTCIQRETIFKGPHCIIEFLQQLLKYDPKTSNYRGITCIAHNAKNFDSVFLLRQILLSIPNADVKLCMKGFKLLRIQIKNYISFIDSLMFLPMPLASFTKTFGLDSSLSKGYFPYLFLTFENWTYIGPIPDKKYFALESKSDEEKLVFDTWYEGEKSKSYNLEYETIYYCSNDVTLLRHGCLKFMEVIIEIAEINPFFECFTLPQLSLLIYRKKFMPRNKLGIVPRNNYHSDTNQSRSCRKWLTYLNYFQPSTSNQPDFFIEAEVKLDCGLQVDGYCKNYPFIKNNKPTVMEYSGCFFHSCNVCYKPNPYTTHYTNSLKGANKLEQAGLFSKQRYFQTLAKNERLKELGYNVIHTWEHTFDKFLRENPKVDKMISDHPFVNYSNLDARSAVYGGRNEAGMLYYEVKKGEKMKFYDYCSLYSYSMLTSKYFLREPIEILMHKQCDNITISDLNMIDGLIYCKVLPNPKLFFPVLPYRCKNKLMFLSCKTCAESFSLNECRHSVEERSITGVWSLCECKVAFERGYKLLQIFEIWRYETEAGSEPTISDSITYDELMMKEHEFDKENSSGIFTAYQKTFIRLKAESSGFPKSCTTIEDKKAFIVDFYKTNNVILRMNHIESNPSKRSLAKLFLNSLYGKLIQQETESTTTILRDPRDLKFYLNSDIYDILDFYCINDNYAVISWRMRTDDENTSIQTHPSHSREQKNISITTGIQTTTGARLRLYSEIEKLGDRCLYMDTDSILFLQRNDSEYCPSLSTAIGGLSDELEKYRVDSFDPYIKSFCCIGPKSYCYTVVNRPEGSEDYKEITVVRCKGLSLKGETAKKVNMELMKSFVLGENFTSDDDDFFYFNPIQTRTKRIRTIKNFKVITRYEQKKIQFTFDKRIVKEGYKTYPFGYIK